MLSPESEIARQPYVCKTIIGFLAYLFDLNCVCLGFIFQYKCRALTCQWGYIPDGGTCQQLGTIQSTGLLIAFTFKLISDSNSVVQIHTISKEVLQQVNDILTSDGFLPSCTLKICSLGMGTIHPEFDYIMAGVFLSNKCSFDQLLSEIITLKNKVIAFDINSAKHTDSGESVNSIGFDNITVETMLYTTNNFRIWQQIVDTSHLEYHHRQLGGICSDLLVLDHTVLSTCAMIEISADETFIIDTKLNQIRSMQLSAYTIDGIEHITICVDDYFAIMTGGQKAIHDMSFIFLCVLSVINAYIVT